MDDEQVTGPGPAAPPFMPPYAPPQVLSSEPLERLAGGCDGTAGLGTNYPDPPCLSGPGSA